MSNKISMQSWQDLALTTLSQAQHDYAGMAETFKRHGLEASFKEASETSEYLLSVIYTLEANKS